MPYYSAVERGVQNLTLLSLARLARSLDIPPSVLLKEAEDLDLAQARLEPPRPPRRGRPRGAIRRR